MHTTYIHMEKLKRYVETENDTLTPTCMCTHINTYLYTYT